MSVNKMLSNASLAPHTAIISLLILWLQFVIIKLQKAYVNTIGRPVLMPFIEVDSRMIYMEEHGKSNPSSIILFHGGPGAGCAGLELLAIELGERYHVISFDQCGVSRSDAIREDESFGMTEHIELIDNMRKVLGIDSWTVLGHSYGGILACLYAYTYPQSTDAVIYVSTAWDIGMSARAQAAYLIPYFKRINSEEGINNCIRLIQNEFENSQKAHNYLRASIVPLIKDLSECLFIHMNEDEFAKKSNIWHSATPVPKNSESKNSIHRQKLREGGEIYSDFYIYLNKIDKPSLFLAGRYDPLGGAFEQACFLNNSPCGKVVEFKNSGHFPHIEEPEAFLEAVIDFMDKLS